jgi:hypothetical protein
MSLTAPGAGVGFQDGPRFDSIVPTRLRRYDKQP